MVAELFTALLLAVIQGITEWLPISSSGHLVLFERLFAYKGGLLFDVALHFGTLMAVFVYFGKDITEIIRTFFTGKWETESGKLGISLIIASIPAAIVGFFAADFFDSVLTDLRIVALGFGVTGLLLFISALSNGTQKKITQRGALLVGIAQALAIIPGISRSGTTLAASLLIGLEEKTAMKFSFLLSIPIIFGASIYTVGNASLPSELIWATLVSFIVGLITIHLLFTKILVSRKNYRWFGFYCLLLALIVSVFAF